ncbi:uncharacterized protein LOC125769503 [Anopheles funestus]|uniref:uncharacterized protein LOC125769503 n=1 Tax=Anopheles funestus TaxID=62324 RepID=UPI0020C5DA0C|nr:uncharacterized protein LOC125769503 [Anopheles funestus]
MEGARGRSSMHGNSYHLRMAMVVLLRAFTLRREDKLSEFKITMEDPNAGKFDDVVFQYSSPCTPKDLAYVYIQAKHKQTSDRVRNVPSITEATLLTKWNSKGAFSIPMYFVSYLNGYEESLVGSHTYILCTNASIDRHLLEYMTIQTQEVDHILSFCDAIGGTCYSFSSENEFKTLTNELRNASLEKLGQMIAQHVKNKKPISCNICIFNIYVTLIAKFVHELDTGIFQFNEGFRSSEDSTAIGIVRSGFMEEYLKSNPKAGPTVEWEKIQIMVDQPLSNSILKASSESSEETSCYDIVNIVIQQFYKKIYISMRIDECDTTWPENYGYNAKLDAESNSIQQPDKFAA